MESQDKKPKSVGWRLPPDLVKQIKRDAVERGVYPSRIVVDRLRESFAEKPIVLTS